MRWRANGVWLAALMLACACGSGGAKPAQTAEGEPSGKEVPVPEELRAEVQRAEVLGRAIQRVDRMAWVATDAAIAQGHQSTLGGWVVDDRANEPSVWFLMRGAEPPALGVRVRLAGSGSAPQVETLEPALPLTGELLSRHQALETASSQRVPLCKRPYNHAVVPASVVGEEGWYVWLLAATDREDELVMGIHHRFRVSADGRSVLDHRQLTKSCIALQREAAPEGGQMAGFFISHLVTPAPTETHVFASLWQPHPVYVVTEGGRLWKVERGAVAKSIWQLEPE